MLERDKVCYHFNVEHSREDQIEPNKPKVIWEVSTKLGAQFSGHCLHLPHEALSGQATTTERRGVY